MDKTMTTQKHAYDSTRTPNTGIVTKESQERQILAYLKSGKTLTSRQAGALFNCDRLSARVHALRERGYRDNIKTVRIKTYSGKQIGRYHWEDSE